MALGLRLTITDTQANTTEERVLDRFPVRIGRNPLNDVRLDRAFVSQFHAVLELVDGELQLRDIGSRNGTVVEGVGQVPPHQLIPLQAAGNIFQVSQLSFRCSVEDVKLPAGTKRRVRQPGTADSFAATAMANDMSTVKSAMLLVELKREFDAYRESWKKLHDHLVDATKDLDPAGRAQTLLAFLQTNPGATSEPEMQKLLKNAGIDSAATGSEDANIVSIVRELAAGYVPQAKTASPQQLGTFLGKMAEAIDVFVKSFIPLRDGYRQFETKMEIHRPKTRSGRFEAAAGAAEVIETAPDPAMLASQLLDWRDISEDAPRAIEGVFADLMIHQVAMLDGVMRGVKTLLRELSPKVIQETSVKKKQGFSFGPWRFKGLWLIYNERFSDLADEDKETFNLIFGPQFAKAYTQLAEAQDSKRASQLPPQA